VNNTWQEKRLRSTGTASPPRRGRRSSEPNIEDRPRYFAGIRENDLARAGRVAVIEPDVDAGGIVGLMVKDGHASSAPDVRQEMRDAGYDATSSHGGDLVSQIFEIFIPAP